MSNPYAQSDTRIPVAHVRPIFGLRGTYQVPSQSRSGQYHKVVYYRDGAICCSCEYNTFKGAVCKHIVATARYRTLHEDHSVALEPPRVAEQPAPQADPAGGVFDRLRAANQEVEAAVQAFAAARLGLEAAVKAQSAAMMAAVGEVK